MFIISLNYCLMQLFPFILLSSQPPLTSSLLNISAALNKNNIQINVEICGSTKNLHSRKCQVPPIRASDLVHAVTAPTYNFVPVKGWGWKGGGFIGCVLIVFPTVL